MAKRHVPPERHCKEPFGRRGNPVCFSCLSALHMDRRRLRLRDDEEA